MRESLASSCVTRLYCDAGHLVVGSNLKVIPNKNRGDGREPSPSRTCRTCYNAYMRAWDKKHEVQVRADNNRQKKARAEGYKKIVFNHYGSFCHCCGIDEPEFLTLEHVGGGGGEHRKKRTHPSLVFLDIIRAGSPDTYSVLCYNCNMARRWGHTCPHQRPLLSIVRSAS